MLPLTHTLLLRCAFTDTWIHPGREGRERRERRERREVPRAWWRRERRGGREGEEGEGRREGEGLACVADRVL